jgi:pimeloyl-ACP methyl ester carboxylesterase
MKKTKKMSLCIAILVCISLVYFNEHVDASDMQSARNVEDSTHYPVIFIHGHSANQSVENTWEYMIATYINEINGYSYYGKIWSDTASNLTQNSLSPKSIFSFCFYRSGPDKQFGKPIGHIGAIPKKYEGRSDHYYRRNGEDRISYSDRLSNTVNHILNATGAKKVSLVCHSMGGLVARAYIRWGGGVNTVNKLLTIGTPNKGNPDDIRNTLSQIAEAFKGADWQVGGEYEEMSKYPSFEGRSYTDWLNDNWQPFCSENQIRYAAIIGDYCPWINIVNIGDGVIDVSDAKMNGAEFNDIIDAAHMDSFNISFLAEEYSKERSLTSSSQTANRIINWIFEESEISQNDNNDSTNDLNIDNELNIEIPDQTISFFNDERVFTNYNVFQGNSYTRSNKKDLMAEQDAFGLKPIYYPNPEDKDYIIKNVVTSSKEENFNCQKQKTQSITITGKKIVIEQGNPNYLYQYHDNDDIKVMTIYAESLIIRDPFRLPQTNVNIYAKELRFEDKSSNNRACIITTPRSIEQEPEPQIIPAYTHISNPSKTFYSPGIAEDGLKAGNVNVYCDSFHSDSNYSQRFVLEGGKGQQAGKGRDGEDEIPMPYQKFDNYDFVVYREFKKEKKCCGIGCWPCGWKDTEYYGTKSWPKSGTDAVQAGKPGEGGTGGSFTSNKDLSKYINISGGKAGKKAPDNKGGRPGAPSKAIWLFQKKYWDGDQKHDVTQNPNQVTNGKDALAPEAKKPIGDPGSFDQVDESYKWLTTYLLQTILFHAEDVYLHGHLNDTYSVLDKYIEIISNFKNSNEWNKNSDTQQLEIQQIQDKMQNIVHRIQNNMDYFGNPAGWTPMLSFESTKQLYENEIDSAINALYLSYWIGNVANSLENRISALSTMKKKLKDEIRVLREEYNSNVGLIPGLVHEANEIKNEIDFRINELQQLEQRLLKIAKENVEKKSKVPFWKKATNILASICKIVPIGQPVIGSIGKGLSAVSDFENQPIQSIIQFVDIAGDFTNENFDKSVKDFQNGLDKFVQDGLDTIDLNNIEKNGIINYAKDLQTFADPIVKSVNKAKNLFKEQSAPRNKVEAEFQKIKANSPEYNELVEKIRILSSKKEIFSSKLASAMQNISKLSNAIQHNILALDAANIDLSENYNTYDQRVIVYIKSMERRAKERLLKYHYLMTKAYEYRMLEPYTGVLDLNRLFERFRIIAENVRGSELNENEFKSLKSIYEEDISSIVKSIIDKMESNRPSRTLSIYYKLSEENIAQLNKAEPVRINLVEMGIIPPTEENLRILDIKANNIKIHAENYSDEIYGNIDIKVLHSGISKLTKNGKDYLFRHYNNNTHQPIIWEDRLTLPTNEIQHAELNASSSSLLLSLLKILNAPTNNLLMYSRPAAWADLLISCEIHSQVNSKLMIEELTFEIEYDFEDVSDNLKRLFILPTDEYALNPEVSINTSDLNGRKDGFGTFVRTYPKNSSITISAPEAIGDFLFESWVDRFGNPIHSINSKIDIVMDNNKSIKPKYIKITDDIIECIPHFRQVWNGIPNYPMSLHILRPEIEGLVLDKYDEIAVFDGNTCVGTKVLSGKITDDRPLTVKCSKDDGMGNGFTEGHEISFKIWDADKQKEIDVNDLSFYDMSGNIKPSVFESNRDYVVNISNNNSVNNSPAYLPPQISPELSGIFKVYIPNNIGGITSYSWDINSDGVIDTVTSTNILKYQFTKSGIYKISVTINKTNNETFKLGPYPIRITETPLCTPVKSGDWIISESCILKESFNAPASVIIKDMSCLIISPEVNLDIDLKQSMLKVEKGSGVLLKKGASLK